MSSPPTPSNPNLSNPLEHFSLLNHNILERLTRWANLLALGALLKRREMKTMAMQDVDLVHRETWEKEMRALGRKVQGLKPQSRYGG